MATNAFIKLFKAVPAEVLGTYAQNNTSFSKMVKHGYVVVHPTGELVSSIPELVHRTIVQYYGLDAKEMNQTFHKSFNTVQNASMDALVAQQLLNYMSNYGSPFELNYVPTEELDVPADLPKHILVFVVVEKAHKTMLVNHFLKTVKAPTSEQVELIRDIFMYATISANMVASNELRLIAFVNNNEVPANADEFLRYLIYRYKGDTLLIRNDKMYRALHDYVENHTSTIEEVLARADLQKLASGFYRNKKLFLALKTNKSKKINGYINKIRRLAKTNHQPVSPISVQNYWVLDGADRAKVRARASNRDLVKLINYVRSTKIRAPKIYTIRNGKTWVEETPLSLSHVKCQDRPIVDELARRLTPVLKDKVFYIPGDICYAAPTTNKQMTANIPWGTKLVGPTAKSLVTGIHWYNISDDRNTDLDMHLQSVSEHLGWNGSYRTTNFLYSGDNTSAPKPHGASEAAWIGEDVQDKYVLTVNYFNHYATDEKPQFTFFIGSGSKEDMNKNYVYNPGKALVSPLPIKMDNNSITLGLLDRQNDQILFTLYGGSITDNSIPDENQEDYIAAIEAKCRSMITLEDILSACGAEVTYTIPADGDYIDLSPAALSPTTLLDIIDGTVN